MQCGRTTCVLWPADQCRTPVLGDEHVKLCGRIGSVCVRVCLYRRLHDTRAIVDSQSVIGKIIKWKRRGKQTNMYRFRIFDWISQRAYIGTMIRLCTPSIFLFRRRLPFAVRCSSHVVTVIRHDHHLYSLIYEFIYICVNILDTHTILLQNSWTYFICKFIYMVRRRRPCDYFDNRA